MEIYLYVGFLLHEKTGDCFVLMSSCSIYLI